ncbi:MULTISPECIES: Flp family type IVb pilin [unclassified Nesterenkonia]|uniref:Flp family type IVb pilin n=1 Tax=unclassified Nesterenkonia TaxID=2629769 RepID=UPI001F4D1D5D|nr:MULTISPECIES: Flp family type IVb pilin [unclassified Nesterenkonia]MCH8560940.1 Flp family type IVb pilin [Nesterenkonia sp. DZ6]MCH8571020.1 Flp family type IVb pilin [Nesterenkonia sp. AY15]
MNRAYALVATLQSFMTDRFEGRKDRGATAVEYGLLVGLIAVVIIAAVILLGNTLDGLFGKVNTELTKTTTP